MIPKKLLIALIMLIATMPVQAGSQYFVDFDGDGFHDNIIDVDNNSIPDEFQSHVKTTNSSSRTFTFSPLSLSTEISKTSGLKVSEQFALNQFKARLLTNCRSNFEIDFNTSLNVNSSSSSNCAGGICY